MAAIELTQVQRECLEHRGVCDGCPNNILESGPCQVKYSKGVAKKLGLREKPMANPCRLRNPVTKVCQRCEMEFVCWTSHGQFCTPCAALKTNDSECLRKCKACGFKFFGSSSALYCENHRRGRVGA